MLQTIKSLEDVMGEPGVHTHQGIGAIHLSPIPNWYGCIDGFQCPRCESEIRWKWEFRKLEEHLDRVPFAVEVMGQVLEYGHRWLKVKCPGCGQVWFAHNFDRRPERSREEETASATAD